MKTVQKSVLIWYSADEMFALVTDVARYPQFLPWCDQAQVLDAHPAGMKAQISIAFGGIRQSFTTRNDHIPGQQVLMKLVDGPFSSLDGQWTFTAISDPHQTMTGTAPRACRVSLQLRYGFDNLALGALVGPVFDKIAASLVDAFVKRAEQVYA
jgi:ribosome-associated toxin RatA of RatAB toxin-antitoxin module